MNDAPACINQFLEMCAESLDPESMENVRHVVRQLCENRHIDEDEIYSWGLPDPAA